MRFGGIVREGLVLNRNLEFQQQRVRYMNDVIDGHQIGTTS